MKKLIKILYYNTLKNYDFFNILFYIKFNKLSFYYLNNYEILLIFNKKSNLDFIYNIF